MTITLNGDTGITTPTYGGAVTAEYQVPVTAFKNRIINGDMMIDQRNAGASVSNLNGYGLDRWYSETSLSTTAIQQVSDAPVGFTKSLKATTSTGGSVSSGSYWDVFQRIEGYNFADFNFGTASAQPMAISFWVKSSVTGTFSICTRLEGTNVGVAATYTINSPSTWEYKTVTVSGSTAYAPQSTTNGFGLTVYFILAAGATYQTSSLNTWQAGSTAGYFGSSTATNALYTTTGATWQVTGVQLEKGSTATSFDYRPYGTELALCQRYCVLYAGNNGSCFASGMNYTTVNAWGSARMPVTMRTTPTLSCVTGTQYYRMFYNTTYQSFDAVLDAGYAGSDNLGNLLFNNTLSGLTAGAGNIWLTNNASSKLLYTAEL